MQTVISFTRSVIASLFFIGTLVSFPERMEAVGVISSLVDWGYVSLNAEKFVDSESLAYLKLGQCGDPIRNSLLFAHYYPPFPLSFDNKAADDDKYRKFYMNGPVDGGDWTRFGGYINARPLPAGPWKSQFWQEINIAIEIRRAQNALLDGFAIDIAQLNRGKLWENIERVYQTADALGRGFKILAEPDMWTLSDATADDIVDALRAIDLHRSAWRLEDGRLVVAPYWAQRRPPIFWEDVQRKSEAAGLKVALFPILVFDENTAPDIIRQVVTAYGKISFGISEWGSRNPETAVARARDITRVASELGLKYMQPIVPQDVRPRKHVFFETGASELFATDWALSKSHSPLAQIVTWNDYGENTEIAPSSKIGLSFFNLTRMFASQTKCRLQTHPLQDGLIVIARAQTISQSNLERSTTYHLSGRGPIKNVIDVYSIHSSLGALTIRVDDQIVLQQSEKQGVFRHTVGAKAGTWHAVLSKDDGLSSDIEIQWGLSSGDGLLEPLYLGVSKFR